MAEMSRKKLFLSGCKEVLPLVLANFPFSFIVGALSIGCGLSVLKSTLMSFLVFAGSAQIVALSLVQQHTEIFIILFTTLVINLRHILYSASMSVFMSGYSIFTRAMASFGLTDEVFASNIAHMKENKNEPKRIYFYFGVMLTFWFFWVLANFLGAVVGASVPDINQYGLDFAMVASFTSIVVPQLKNKPMVIAAITAGVAAIVLHEMPYQLGLMAASLIGITTGVILSRVTSKPNTLAPSAA